MPWPIVSLAIKLISLKFAKGATFGIARYIKKIFSATPQHDDGRPKTGVDKLNHVLTRESVARENVIFLLLMLGNVFYGLQELVLWTWDMIARRLYDEFFMGMPAALQDPTELCQQLKDKPWSEILRTLTRWMFIASLVHWPSMNPDGLFINRTRDPRWIEVRYGKHVYLMRTDKARRRQYRKMQIDADGHGNMSITAPVGERVLTQFVRAL